MCRTASSSERRVPTKGASKHLRSYYARGVLLFVVAVYCCTLVGPIHAQRTVSGDLDIHDPSTILIEDGRYYMFGTGGGIISKSSSNRLFWQDGPSVFNTPPSWTFDAVPGFEGFFWAPDMMHFNGLYHLYYSVSTFGSQTSAIGLVTNPTLDPSAPHYQWTDQGPVIQSQPGLAYNAIDAGLIQDEDNRLWMTFGSFNDGIHLFELDPETGKRVSPNSRIHRLADNSSIESPYLYQHEDHYYLFVNWGSCCSGLDSTYNIRVGRSTSITGPYLDKNGNNMVNGGGSLFLGSEGDFIGPGHFAVLEDGPISWFGYHYYDGTRNGAPTFDMRALEWDENGWPDAGDRIASGDVNGDGFVNEVDFEQITSNLFLSPATRAEGDLTGDEIVDYEDFRLWKSQFSPPSPLATNKSHRVPEPNSLMLIVASLCSAFWIRQRGMCSPPTNICPQPRGAS